MAPGGLKAGPGSGPLPRRLLGLLLTPAAGRRERPGTGAGRLLRAGGTRGVGKREEEKQNLCQSTRQPSCGSWGAARAQCKARGRDHVFYQPAFPTAHPQNHANGALSPSSPRRPPPVPHQPFLPKPRLQLGDGLFPGQQAPGRSLLPRSRKPRCVGFFNELLPRIRTIYKPEGSNKVLEPLNLAAGRQWWDRGPTGYALSLLECCARSTALALQVDREELRVRV